jgi:hypothetical protein
MRVNKAIVSALLLVGGVSAMALEKPQYAVVQKTSDFELRRYQPYIVAATSVRAEFEDAGNEGFRRLFRYIAGHNQARGKITMTAPVGQTRGEKIAMTAPVNQRSRDGDWLVTFMMPSRYSMETLPQPLDPRVSLQQVPGRLMAVRRYSGRWTQARYQRQQHRLETALTAAGLTVVGDPELARYDPPFMPWPFRRNEVLLPVADAGLAEPASP